MGLLPMRDCFNRKIFGQSCVGCFNGSIFGCNRYIKPRIREKKDNEFVWCKELDMDLILNSDLERIYCKKCNFECGNKKDNKEEL